MKDSYVVERDNTRGDGLERGIDVEFFFFQAEDGIRGSDM